MKAKIVQQRWLSWLMLAVALSAAAVAPAQETHPTTPGITAAETHTALDLPAAMSRAREALVAAGLTPHAPMPHTIGGSNEWVAALINVEVIAGRTRASVSAASHPDRRGESHRTCLFLIDYMRSGLAPGGGSGAPPLANVAGRWEESTEQFGVTTWDLTLRPDGRYDAQQTGFGQARGVAFVRGNTLRIDWRTPAGTEGYHEYSFDGTGGLGSGRVEVLRNGTIGVFRSTLKRPEDFRPAPGPAPGGGGPAVAPLANAAGRWEESTEQFGVTTWDLTLRPDGRYDAQQAGFGQARGIAVVRGNTLRIDWRTPAGAEGYHEYSFDSGGGSGTGRVEVLRNGTIGVFRSTLKRPANFRAAAGGPGGQAIARGPPVTGDSPPPGSGEFEIKIEPPRFSVAPLPLPPVGTVQKKVAGVSSVGAGASLGKPLPALTAKIASLQATHVPDRVDPRRFDGSLIVTAVLTEPGLGYYVDLCIGGYLYPTKDGFHGNRYVGSVAAYQAYRIGARNRGDPAEDAHRSVYVDRIPKVLPARIRAELYFQAGGATDHLVDQRETTFDMPWADKAPVTGALVGDQAKGRVTRMSASVTGGAESVGIYVPSARRLTYAGSALAVLLRLAPGESQGVSTRGWDILPDARWEFTEVTVGPEFQDRDHRNNTFWPNLPNSGHVESPLACANCWDPY